jgi:hypothetical protein
MAAASAAAPQAAGRDPRHPLQELTGFYLAVDRLSPGCGRERNFALAKLVSFYGGQRTVGDILRRMRYSAGCGGRVGAAWLATGPGC